MIAEVLLDLLAHENVVLTDMPADLASAAIAGVRHQSARHNADALIAAAARHARATELVPADHRFSSHLVPLRPIGRSRHGSAGSMGEPVADDED